MGGRTGSVNVRKLLGWDKEGLIVTARATYTYTSTLHKVKQRVNWGLLTGRQVFSYLQDSQAPSHISVTWEEKTTSFWTSPNSFFFFQLYMTAEHDITWSGIPLWSAVVSCPHCLLPASCARPNYSLVEWSEKKQRPWWCVSSFQL